MPSNMLHRLLFFSISFISCFTKYAGQEINGIVNGTELLLTFLVFRHGDRTPLDSNLSFSNHPEVLAEIVDQYGYGQLTQRGVDRSFQIGQFIRCRYCFLLSPQYNESEIYIRSSNIRRTKQTVLTAMTAVYPSFEGNWNLDMNWITVPHTTEDNMDDYILAFGNCPKYIAFAYFYQPKFTELKDIMEKWSNISGVDFISDPQQAYRTYDVFTSQLYLGLPLDDAIEDIWQGIEEVAKAVMETCYINEEYLHLLTGVLLTDFFNATTLIKGGHTQKVRVYSGHDINVDAMVAASKIKKEARPGIPHYGATFALEFRRMVVTGQYVVLVVYVPDPDKDEVLYLPVDGCDSLLCDLDYFRNITTKFTLDKSAWKEACKVDHEVSIILI